jgi:site-specific recombinase XerD
MFLSKVGDVYYLFFSDESGTRHKVSTMCRKKSDAFTFLQQFKQNEFERRKKLKAIFFSDFIEQFKVYSSSVHTLKTQKTNSSAFKEFLRVEGNKPLQSIGIREIEHFLSKKKMEASEWTARKYYGSLASAFEKAVQWNYLEENPFRKVAKPKGREIIPVFFTESDFRLLLSVIEDRDFKELCITALLSGLRLGELLALQWNDIDFNSKVILVRNSETFTTKSRKNRIVPMSDELFRVLGERKERIRFECEIVFHNKYGGKLLDTTVSHYFKLYVIDAGINDKLHFHSLRHSFASALVMSGVSLYAVQKLLGHTTSKTTEIYSHLLPQQLHFEVNKGLHSIEGSLLNPKNSEVKDGSE